MLLCVCCEKVCSMLAIDCSKYLPALYLNNYTVLIKVNLFNISKLCPYFSLYSRDPLLVSYKSGSITRAIFYITSC